MYCVFSSILILYSLYNVHITYIFIIIVGSSTDQAPGRDSEVYLNPVAYYPDPFRPADGNYIVLCECVLPDGKLTPIRGNTRRAANEVMTKAKEHVPWFGLEQEYVLYEKDNITVLGWPKHGYPAPQGPYYCSVGTDHSFGRQVVEAHLRACAFAGLTISGANAEVMPGQWEFQVGPCEGISSGDQLWAARYILHRVCEDFGVIVSLDPKPHNGWSGSGCHANYSTSAMRNEGGYKHIERAVACLAKRHTEHITCYGQGNDKRLSGNHETASFLRFSSGVADRYSSIRIPRTAVLEGKGYLEDRRPASNCDPYLVTKMLVSTTILDADDLLREESKVESKVDIKA